MERKVLPGCDFKLYRFAFQGRLVQDVPEEKFVDTSFCLLGFALVFIEDGLDGGCKDLPVTLAGVPQKGKGEAAPMNTDLLPVAKFIRGERLTVIQMIIGTG